MLPWFVGGMLVDITREVIQLNCVERVHSFLVFTLV